MKCPPINLCFLLALCCCQKNKDTDIKSQQHDVWFKRPEQIEQIVKKWGVYVSRPESSLYFKTLGLFYGGIDRLEHKTLLSDRADGSYLLAINTVAQWLSQKLISHVKVSDEHDLPVPIIFYGAVASPADKGCFADDSKDWCDFDDQIVLGMFDKKNFPRSKEQRKRVMHNIQDIGDFLRVPIDNRVTVDAKCQDNTACQHAPQYLLDRVFIPSLQQPSPSATSRDNLAWQQVIYTILLSGPFFTNIEFKVGG